MAPFNELKIYFGYIFLGLKSLFKGALLWIYLLMEIQFKNILKKAKAIENGLDPLSKSFAGELFKGSSWYLSLMNIEAPKTVDLPIKEVISAPLVELQPPLLKILFLGDTHDGTGEDLLAKMIQAMGLPKDAIKRIFFNEQKDNREELLNAIKTYRPEVVVSLGAIVTNILLEKKEKLSSIHGHFIESEAESWKFLLVPIFHPEFLLINPNMKRTAWNDLQKIMELFKKDS